VGSGGSLCLAKKPTSATHHSRTITFSTGDIGDGTC
jgi:hypothetical protein